jgi:hypothetical protein
MDSQFKTKSCKFSWFENGCYFVMAVLFSSVASAQATKPSISGDILSLPVAANTHQKYSSDDFNAYRLDFRIVEEGGVISLELTDSAVLDDADTEGAPSYYCIFGTFSCYLNIPDLDVGGESFWGEFQQVEASTIKFELKAAAVNDAGDSGLEGTWRMTQLSNPIECGALPYFRSDNLVINSSDQGLMVDGALATQVGSTVEWTATTQDGEGTLTYTATVTFDSNNRGSGSMIWEYSDSTSSCPGSAEITELRLLHN